MFEEGCSNAQGGASSATDDTFRGVERFVARRLAAVGDNMEESSSLANLLLLQRRAAQKRSVQGGVAGGRLGAVVLDEALVHDEDALVDTLSKARSLGASYVALNASAGAMRDSLPALLDILGASTRTRCSRLPWTQTWWEGPRLNSSSRTGTSSPHEVSCHARSHGRMPGSWLLQRHAAVP